MSHQEKIAEAIRHAYARGLIAVEVIRQLPNIEQLVAGIFVVGGVLAGLGVAAGAAASTGVGAVLEGIAASIVLALAAIGIISSAKQVIAGITVLLNFYAATGRASTYAELDAAGRDFATGIAEVGVGTIMMILSAVGARQGIRMGRGAVSKYSAYEVQSENSLRQQSVEEPLTTKSKRVRKEALEPGTVEHKADRWKRYQARNGEWSYDRWSRQYDTNMANYQRGLRRESAYRTEMGASEGTLKTPLTDRQIDILDKANMYAGQLKTGPVSLTKENALAISKDAELVKQGWQVEHILEQGASEPYIDALKEAGIDYHIGAKIPVSEALQ